MINFKWLDNSESSSKMHIDVMTEPEFKLFVAHHIRCDFIFERIHTISDVDRLVRDNELVKTAEFDININALYKIVERGIPHALIIDNSGVGFILGDDIPTMFDYAKQILYPYITIRRLNEKF